MFLRLVPKFAILQSLARGGGVRTPCVEGMCESDERERTVTLSAHFQDCFDCHKGRSTGSAGAAEGVKKRTCVKTTAEASALPAWPFDPDTAEGVKNLVCPAHVAFVEYVVFRICKRPWFVTLYGHVQRSPGQYFQVHRGFPVVCDYGSGKRRDPIATANSVQSIVQSS